MQFKDYLIFKAVCWDLQHSCLSCYCSWRAQAGKGFSECVYQLGPPPQNTAAAIFIQDNDVGDDHCIASPLDNMAQFQILPEMYSLAPEQRLSSEGALKLLSELSGFM